jgi:hypothetical protein
VPSLSMAPELSVGRPVTFAAVSQERPGETGYGPPLEKIGYHMYYGGHGAYLVPLTSFRDVGAIRNALQTGGLGPEVRGVMYDYEKWRFTPEEQQQNPAGYVKQAADLVHARGLLFLTAPAVNLVTVLAARRRPRSNV